MDILGGLGVERLQEGDDVMAELVAGGVILEVGGVGDVGLTFPGKICLDVGAAHVEQWAEDVTVDGAYACHATNACSTHHVHEHCLYIVIAVMCHHDGFGSYVLAQLLEVSVAQFACGEFDAHLMQGGVFLGVEMPTMQGHAEPLAQRDDKGLVAVGLVSTQVEVAVYCLHRAAFVYHLEQQADAVCPAAYCY